MQHNMLVDIHTLTIDQILGVILGFQHWISRDE